MKRHVESQLVKACADGAGEFACDAGEEGNRLRYFRWADVSLKLGCGRGSAGGLVASGNEGQET